MTYLNKFILPKERIPKPFSQNIREENGKLITSVNSCVACTFTKILEVINYLKTGTYIELSKGYMYGRNGYPDSKRGGMTEEYTLNIMLKRGTVPVSMCNDYDEIPEIVNILNSRSDIEELDKKAEETKIKGWEDISGNNSKQLFENVKKYLNEKQIPLAVRIKNWHGEPHEVVAVGYEDDNILWQNHDGTDEIRSLKYTAFIEAYYIDGGIELTDCIDNSQPLIDNYKKGESVVLKPITEINDIVWELANAGIITNSQMWMEKCELDINVYWLCRKMANKLRGTLE